MKPLTLEETRLKEEMKERCLNKGQYIDKNAKAKFYMLCHLEDFEVQFWELKKKNKKLKDNWNKLKEWLDSEIENQKHTTHWEVERKMQEVEQGSDSE